MFRLRNMNFLLISWIVIFTACGDGFETRIDDVPFALDDVKSVSAGESHSCAIRGDDGEVWCWGSGSHGQAGVDAILRREAGQVRVQAAGASTEPLSGAVELVSGASHSCALLESGRVACWGSNSNGQLGVPGLEKSAVARYVRAISGNGFLENVQAIAAGYNHTCVSEKPASRLVCWGFNKQGQIGATGVGGSVDRPTIVRASPNLTHQVQGVTQIAAGERHTCVLFRSGWVGCIGDNTTGQRGEGQLGVAESWDMQSVQHFSAEGLKRLESVQQITSGREHSCAVTRVHSEDGEVYCWGSNENRRGGSDARRTLFFAVPVRDLNGKSVAASQVSGGFNHTCALLPGEISKVQCWGLNTNGQLGAEDASEIFPVYVRGFANEVYLRDISDIAAGGHHSCATTKSGRVICWGQSEYGQTGFQAWPADKFDADFHAMPTVVLTEDVTLIEGAASVRN